MNKKYIRLTEQNLYEIIKSCVKNSINEIFKEPRNSICEFGVNAYSKKIKYAKSVWNLIQRSYRAIGGCKSFKEIGGDGGFNDFLTSKYIWRVFFDNDGKVIGAAIYKTSEFGRKMICIAALNKIIFNKLIEKDLNKSVHTYGEASGKPEHLLNNIQNISWVPNADAGNIINKETDINQHPEIDKNELTPYNPNIHYYRDIAGVKHRKALFGNPIKLKK